MVRVFLFLFAAHVVLVVLALIGCLSAERSRVRALPRLLWAPVIVLLPLIGPVAWFLGGRPVSRPERRGGPAAPPGPGGRPRPKPAAPDDDPDFLRSLDADQSRRDRELFERWEADLKRREDDLRRKDNGETPQGDTRPE
jgi:hypothetical protein